MSVELYVSNLALDVAESDVESLFANYGTVMQVRRIIIQQTNQPKESMLVEIQEEDVAPAIMQDLNGYNVRDRRLFVTPARPDKLKFNSPEVKAYTEELITRLGETETDPKRQLQNLVQFCGPHFAEVLLEETYDVEQGEGLLVRDGTRRRTTGGVFFHLARQYLANKMQKTIFYVKPTERPKKDKDQKERAPRPGGQAKGGDKGGKPRQDRDKRGGSSAPAPKPVIEVPIILEEPKELTPEIVAEYNNIKQALQDAQQRLAEIQAMPRNKQAGLFSATKEVWQFESQIKAYQKDYPDLD
jgi:RNA recognition motif-containing protein